MTNKPGFIKHKKLAKTLRVITVVLFWLTLVGLILSLISSIVIRALSDTTINSVFNSIKGNLGFTIGNFLTFDIPEGQWDGVNLKPIVSAILTLTTLAEAILIVILKYLIIILRNVEANNPFALENAKAIKIIGIATVVASGAIQIAYAYSAYVAIEAFKITNIGVNFSINVNMLFMGLLIILLSEIFRYGAYLQQEYDETL